MKWLKWMVSALLTLLLVSCYEVNEDIVINANGSGTYVTKMDMSQMVDMMQTFAGDEELTKDGLDRPIDTTILMKDILDSAKDLTPEQKDLLKDGKMKMKINIKEKIFNIDMSYPYKNYAALQQLMSGKGGGTGVADVFQRLFGGKDEDKQEGITDNAKDPALDEISNIYDVTAKDGLISKKINADKLKALTAKPEMEQLKQLNSSGMEIMYTTTIQLPRPVKNADNTMIKLSDDKKTVTIKYNMLELLDHPEKFSYTIEY